MNIPIRMLFTREGVEIDRINAEVSADKILEVICDIVEENSKNCIGGESIMDKNKVLDLIGDLGSFIDDLNDSGVFEACDYEDIMEKISAIELVVQQ
jgi:hypothetical protein